MAECQDVVDLLQICHTIVARQIHNKS